MTPDEMKTLIESARDWVEYQGGPYELILTLADALESVLSVHPAEDAWEYAEFDSDEVSADGTIHEWAEPKDVWDKPLPADELAELRAEGQVYARRRKPSPWSPIPADGG